LPAGHAGATAEEPLPNLQEKCHAWLSTNP
jgi:hypothetical protein